MDGKPEICFSNMHYEKALGKDGSGGCSDILMMPTLRLFSNIRASHLAQSLINGVTLQHYRYSESNITMLRFCTTTYFNQFLACTLIYLAQPNVALSGVAHSSEQHLLVPNDFA